MSHSRFRATLNYKIHHLAPDTGTARVYTVYYAYSAMVSETVADSLAKQYISNGRRASLLNFWTSTSYHSNGNTGRTSKLRNSSSTWRTVSTASSGEDGTTGSRRRTRATTCCSMTTMAAVRRRTAKDCRGVSLKRSTTAAAMSRDELSGSDSRTRARSECDTVASLSGQLVTAVRNMKSGTKFFRATVDCDGIAKTGAFLSADEARRLRLLGLRTRRTFGGATSGGLSSGSSIAAYAAASSTSSSSASSSLITHTGDRTEQAAEVRCATPQPVWLRRAATQLDPGHRTPGTHPQVPLNQHITLPLPRWKPWYYAQQCAQQWQGEKYTRNCTMN